MCGPSAYPPSLSRRAHTVVEADGRQFWVFEDQRSATMGLNAVAGKDPTDWGTDPVRFSDLIPGCYDAAARAEDFRADGIVGSVLFPSLPGFGGRVFFEMKDKELADLCVKAYNDFVIDEWCPAAPESSCRPSSPNSGIRNWRPPRCAGAPNGGRARCRSPRTRLPQTALAAYRSLGSGVPRVRGDRTGVLDASRLEWTHSDPDARLALQRRDHGCPGSGRIETITDMLFGTLPRASPMCNSS